MKSIKINLPVTVLAFIYKKSCHKIKAFHQTLFRECSSNKGSFYIYFIFVSDIYYFFTIVKNKVERKDELWKINKNQRAPARRTAR